MPVWGWILIGVAVAVVIALVAMAASMVWNRAVRRYLLQLIGKREEAGVVRRAFDDMVTELREGSDEVRAAFTDDPDAVERDSLSDLAERARRLAEELNTMPLPRRLVVGAEALADASDILAEEAERAGGGSIGDESLEALASVNLERLASAFSFADAQIAALAVEYGVDEQNLYVKGLYI